jgi:hypothetical protein
VLQKTIFCYALERLKTNNKHLVLLDNLIMQSTTDTTFEATIAAYTANEKTWYDKLKEVFQSPPLAVALVSTMRAQEALARPDAEELVTKSAGTADELRVKLVKLVQEAFVIAATAPIDAKKLSAVTDRLRDALKQMKIPADVTLPNRLDVAKQIDASKSHTSRNVG